MASPRTIRAALATRLKTIQGLTVYERMPGQLQTPCAYIQPGAANPEQVFGRGELTKWDMDVYVMAGLAPGYEQAQDMLDRYLATSSTGGVFGAVADDRTLGGVVHGTFVREIRDYDQYEISPDFSVMGAVVSLEIWST